MDCMYDESLDSSLGLAVLKSEFLAELNEADKKIRKLFRDRVEKINQIKKEMAKISDHPEEDGEKLLQDVLDHSEITELHKFISEIVRPKWINGWFVEESNLEVQQNKKHAQRNKITELNNAEMLENIKNNTHCEEDKELKKIRQKYELEEFKLKLKEDKLFGKQLMKLDKLKEKLEAAIKKEKMHKQYYEKKLEEKKREAAIKKEEMQKQYEKKLQEEREAAIKKEEMQKQYDEKKLQEKREAVIKKEEMQKQYDEEKLEESLADEQAFETWKKAEVAAIEFLNLQNQIQKSTEHQKFKKVKVKVEKETTLVCSSEEELGKCWNKFVPIGKEIKGIYKFPNVLEQKAEFLKAQKKEMNKIQRVHKQKENNGFVNLQQQNKTNMQENKKMKENEVVKKLEAFIQAKKKINSNAQLIKFKKHIGMRN